MNNNPSYLLFRVVLKFLQVRDSQNPGDKLGLLRLAPYVRVEKARKPGVL